MSGKYLYEPLQSYKCHYYSKSYEIELALEIKKKKIKAKQKNDFQVNRNYRAPLVNRKRKWFKIGRSPNILDHHLLYKAQTFTVNINQTGINRTIDNINSELA